ncbi:MAG: branched-chain amino acid ABC transporter permease [Dehalobacterium sp.]
MDILQYWDVLVTAVLRGGLYSLMAIGLSLVFGVMNIANFAHGEFYMIGAYFAFFAFSVFGMSPIVSIIVAGLLAFLVGAIVERGLFYPLRLRSKKDWLMNTFLLTLGISIIMQNGVKMLWGSTYRGITAFWPGRIKIGSGGMEIATDRVVGFFIAVAAIAAFVFILNKTKVGRAIRAVSQDETGAGLVGVDLKNIHTLTFALSCMMAALAGACLLSITPAYPVMGVNPLYKSWFVLILVGMGNVGASIVGGLIVGLLETISYFQFGSGWQDVISLTVIILILLFKPNGIFGKKGVKSSVE